MYKFCNWLFPGTTSALQSAQGEIGIGISIEFPRIGINKIKYWLIITLDSHTSFLFQKKGCIPITSFTTAFQEKQKNTS